MGVEGADVAYAKQIIDDVLNAYPLVGEYIEQQHAAVYNPGYAENPFGMRRYFFHSPLSGVMKAQEREAVNFPIQSTVSNILYLALYELAKYKQAHQNVDYRTLLPFHDAAYLLVHHSWVRHVSEEVIPYCMEVKARVPSIGLQLQTDQEFMINWGHKLTIEEAIYEAKDRERLLTR